MDAKREKILVQHRKAKHDYTLSDALEVGLVLLGSEVKSLRTDGNASLSEAFVDFRGDGAWLIESYIAPYTHGNRENHEPRRPRKLLMHRKQIDKMRKATRERGVTVVPLKLYFKGSNVKLEIAVGRGKKQYDKRHALKERDAQKQLRRVKRR